MRGRRKGEIGDGGVCVGGYAFGRFGGARRCGMQTVYVERRGEEWGGTKEVEQAWREGWVDMRVSGGHAAGEGGEGAGWMEVARRFGMEGGEGGEGWERKTADLG